MDPLGGINTCLQLHLSASSPFTVSDTWSFVVVRRFTTHNPSDGHSAASPSRVIGTSRSAEDVDRSGDHQADDHDRCRRLDRHGRLGPPGQGHRVGRAEGDRRAEPQVEVVDEQGPPSGGATSGMACCGTTGPDAPAPRGRAHPGRRCRAPSRGTRRPPPGRARSTRRPTGAPSPSRGPLSAPDRGDQP